MTTRNKKNEEMEEKKRNVGLDSVVCEIKAETFLSQGVSQHPPSCVHWKTGGKRGPGSKNSLHQTRKHILVRTPGN